MIHINASSPVQGGVKPHGSGDPKTLNTPGQGGVKPQGSGDPETLITNNNNSIVGNVSLVRL